MPPPRLETARRVAGAAAAASTAAPLGTADAGVLRNSRSAGRPPQPTVRVPANMLAGRSVRGLHICPSSEPVVRGPGRVCLREGLQPGHLLCSTVWPSGRRPFATERITGTPAPVVNRRGKDVKGSSNDPTPQLLSPGRSKGKGYDLDRLWKAVDAIPDKSSAAGTNTGNELDEKLRSDAKKTSITSRRKHVYTDPMEAFQSFMDVSSNKSIMRNLAKEIGVNTEQIPRIAKDFFDNVINGRIPSLNLGIIAKFDYHNNSEHALPTLITPHWLNFLRPHLGTKDLQRVDKIQTLADMSHPAEEYIQARRLDRKIIMHVGPTNSGKTYKALLRFYGAKSAVYCGPLRLLAHEIYRKCNSKGIPCQLLTGEEVKDADGAQHISCTVEMAPMCRTFEVAIIDEIQLIGDAGRGSAWTRALLGIRAAEIHLCGEESAVPLIEKICKDHSENLIVERCERLTPLDVESSLDEDITKIRPGDCVIAFRRADIFGLRKKIEAQTGLKCAVVYGGLPAEIRAMQASYFNDPADEHKVLVASDAVGMGLNLNIRRMVFNNIEKFHNNSLALVSPSLIKQVAGRAGRFNTEFSGGTVTTMRTRDLSYVEMAMKAPIEPVERAVIAPLWEQIEVFASQFPCALFSEVIRLFRTWTSSADGLFVTSDMTDFVSIAQKTDDLRNMSTQERFLLSCAPVNMRSDFVACVFRLMAERFDKREPCYLGHEIVKNYLALPAKNFDEFEILQYIHQAILLYSWLSYRIPEIYSTPREEIIVQKDRCEFLIDHFLKNVDHRTIYNGGFATRGLDEKVHKNGRTI